MYETDYNTRMVRAEEKIKAALPSEEVASALEILSSTPLLNVERIAFTYGDKPMEWRNGFYLTNDHHYANKLD
jgi:GntR family transcriptional regulator